MKRKTLLGATLLALSLSCSGTVFAEENTNAAVESGMETTDQAADIAVMLQNEDTADAVQEKDIVQGEEVPEEAFLTENSDVKEATGWVEKEDGKHYISEDGTEVVNAIKKIDQDVYLFDDKGALVSSDWFAIDGKFYYADDKGIVQTGLHTIEGVKYYLEEESDSYGVMLTDTQKEIEGVKYSFTCTGEAVTEGWCLTSKGYWYIDEGGEKAQRWISSGGRRYYLDPENDDLMISSAWLTEEETGSVYYLTQFGSMAIGWQDVENEWYYFKTNGEMCKGWKEVNNKWYYLDLETGKMFKTGWHSIDGKWYYMNTYGNMAVGWKYIDNKWYYLGTSGAMCEGWKNINNKWYYLEPGSGRMATVGWHKINGKWYYMNTNGDMATGWKSLNGKWYYMGTSGAMCEGWQKINNKWYYFYHEKDKNGGSHGVMAKDTVIDGYGIDKNGVYLELYAYTKKILDSVGWNLPAAFNWCAHSLSYSYTPASASADSTWYAEYGYKNKRGDCYVFAATFCHLARALGYQAYFVQGYVPQLGGGSVTHGWVEVVVNGTVYVCDPDFTYETGRNGYMINYGNSGTWRYSNYRRVN